MEVKRNLPQNRRRSFRPGAVKGQKITDITPASPTGLANSELFTIQVLLPSRFKLVKGRAGEATQPFMMKPGFVESSTESSPRVWTIIKVHRTEPGHQRRL